MTQIKSVVVGPFQVNCYLVMNADTKAGVIVDPGAEADRIAKEMERLDMTPQAVLLTHGHGDHIAAVSELVERYDLELYIGRDDARLLTDPHANVSALLGMPITAPEPDHLVEDEQLLRVAGMEFLVLSTPGHTPGGVSYLLQREGKLLCGDCVFHGSIGRTDLPGGSHQQLLQAIHEKILRLPDEVVLYPGHGPQTTVGAERTSNPFLIGGQFA